MKVLIIAFGNPDNVLSLSKAVSSDFNLTLLFVLSGNEVKQGVLDLDLNKLEYRLNKDRLTLDSVVDREISSYIGDKFRLWILRTKSRKMIFKRSGFSNFLICIKAAKELKKESFDVIHYNGVSGFIIYFLLVLRNVPKVWTLHDIKPHYGEENQVGGLLNKFLSKLNFQFVQHYKFLKEEFVKLFKVNRGDVHQVYSGPFDVLKEYQPVSLNTGGRFILFTGRITKYKGAEVLVDAFTKISHKYNDIYLVLAGKPGYNIDKGKIAAYRNIIILDRYLRNNELSYLYGNCMFVCTPYLDSTHSAVVMTSYAFLKPVLSSNLKGLDEVVINDITGRLFESGSASSLASEIDNLISDLSVLDKYRSGIRELTDKGFLSWQKISLEMKKVYEKAVFSSV